MSKICTSIIAICTVIGLFFGAYQFNEQRYALADALKKLDVYVQWVELRLDQKVEADALEINENRLIKKKKECEQRTCTEEELIEVETLEKKVERQEKKLDMIQQRIIQ